MLIHILGPVFSFVGVANTSCLETSAVTQDRVRGPGVGGTSTVCHME